MSMTRLSPSGHEAAWAALTWDRCRALLGVLADARLAEPIVEGVGPDRSVEAHPLSFAADHRAAFPAAGPACDAL